jgi:arylsulfatase A
MVGFAAESPNGESTMADQRPSIVYFLADDLGYGDVACLNPSGRIPTPNFDRLAREGMTFTDAHSSSAVCSPSRYSVLTGRYNWRTSLQAGIVQQYGDPLIDVGRLTVAGLLKNHGYRTAAIGKWHLGMGWDLDVTAEFMPAGDRFNSNEYPGNSPLTEQTRSLWSDAFSRPTLGGPTTRGFDRYFGVDVPNWPPFCFIEDNHTVGVPSEYLPSRLFNHNQASTPGPAMPYWNFQQLLPTWAEKADEFFADCARTKDPFFLYLASTSPHTPISPNARWVGKSGLDSPYADFVMETDDVFGQVIDSLERHGLRENTLVIFTSDNGFAPYVGAAHLEQRGHHPSAHLRGYKSDAWDGGHRIPFIARWPGVIAPGTVCDELVCLSDLMATCADILHSQLPPDAGEDSVSMLPLFVSPADGNVLRTHPVREHLVHHSLRGKFAIRTGRWKLVLCPGSGGGWSLSDEDAVRQGLPIVQLYDMDVDPSETTNLEASERARVRELVDQLEELVARGRSTEGPDQTNDVPVDIWKLDTLPGVDASILDDY